MPYESAGDPPSASPAIVVEDLHVRFKVYADQRITLRQQLARGFRSRDATEVHAVRGVSLRIDPGEVVGLLGLNGSGKSTLVGAIAGLLPPTSGRVLVRSQPVLLGVQSALIPDLSGYRNITIGCLAMGMPMGTIRERLDEVAEFTELGVALDRPLRTYSSGMKARLAFAIATLESPDILLIDEALAVGDRSFKQKSLDRVRQLQEAAGAVVMVTHSLGEVSSSCTRAVWMEAGTIVADGDVEEVLRAYKDSVGGDRPRPHRAAKRAKAKRRKARAERASRTATDAPAAETSGPIGEQARA
jgi:teichoic acid transport system ATP-binding protein